MNEFADKHANNPTWAAFNAAIRSDLSSAVATLRSKLAARDLEDDRRKAMNAVDSVKKHVSQRDPSWWKQGLSTDHDMARDLLDELQDKYNGVSEWVIEDQKLRGLLAAAVSALKSKVALREVSDDQRRCRAAADMMEACIQKGDPKWWQSALSENVPQLEGLLSELAMKHIGNDGWTSFDESMFARIQAARSTLKDKLQQRCMADDSRKAESAIARVEGALSKSDPAWWTHGLADARSARDIVVELQDKYAYVIF